MTTHDDAAVRWLPLKNMTNEVIPAFAIVALGEMVELTDDLWELQSPAVESVDGEECWRACKPNAWHERQQNPALHMVNGPAPIYPGETGAGTRTWPARVLHDGLPSGVIDQLANGASCGPRDDSWHVHSSGTAFRALAHASGGPVEQSSTKNIHCVWIEGSSRLAIPVFSFTRPLATIDAGESAFGIDGAIDESVIERQDTAFDVIALANGERAIEVLREGVYHGAFSASMVSAADEPVSGQPFNQYGLKLYRQDGDGLNPTDPENEEATNFWGYRTAIGQIDQYGALFGTPTGNICVPFLIYLRTGQRLVIRSLYEECSINAFCFWIALQASPDTVETEEP